MRGTLITVLCYKERLSATDHGDHRRKGADPRSDKRLSQRGYNQISQRVASGLVDPRLQIALIPMHSPEARMAHFYGRVDVVIPGVIVDGPLRGGGIGGNVDEDGRGRVLFQAPHKDVLR